MGRGGRRLVCTYCEAEMTFHWPGGYFAQKLDMFTRLTFYLKTEKSYWLGTRYLLY